MLRHVLISADPSAHAPRDRRNLAGQGWGAGLALLRDEFPSVQIHVADEVLSIPSQLSMRDWALAPGPDVFDPVLFGPRCEGPPRLHLLGVPTPRTAVWAMEILTRAQPVIQRTNAASRTELFGRVLFERRLHADLDSPDGRAAHLEGLDAWQWLLRMQPEASLPSQLAALLGAGGVADPERALAHLELPAPELMQAAGLLATHPARSTALGDAWSLAFLAHRTSRLFDLDADAGRRALAETLRHLGRAGRLRLPLVRLRADVAASADAASSSHMDVHSS